MRLALVFAVLFVTAAAAEEPSGATAEAVRALVEQTLADRDAAKKDEGTVVGSGLAMKATWKDGVFFETPNRDFWLHPAFNIQYDAAFYRANDQVMFGSRGTGDLKDGVALRRARLRFEGGFWEQFEFHTEMEFANSFATGTPADSFNTFEVAGPTDIWIQAVDVPYIGKVRVGNQKEWFGLEHANSYRFLEFMERSLLFDTFVPSPFSSGRAPGISAYSDFLDGRAFYGVGVAKNVRNNFGFNANDGEYAVTGRLAGLLVEDNGGQRMLEVGASASHRDPVNGEIVFRARPEVRGAPPSLLPLIANTGLIRADTHDLIGVETTGVLGPLSFTAEYMASYLSNARKDDVRADMLFYQGWYAQVTYFLTGESRKWNKTFFAYGRVTPNEPVFFADSDGEWIWGRGAWELAARYTSLDLSNAGINGGVLQNATLGLNWYLNPNSKIQWNYDYTHRSDVGGDSNGDIHAFGMRVAFDY